MQPDRNIITRKAVLIEKDLEKLREIKPSSLSQYLKDTDTQLKVERLLERIIGRLIDINYYILSEKYNLVPKDYYDSFILMSNKKEIESRLALKLAKSSGLRNILAHEYDEVDHKKVFESIKTALLQIPLYLKQVL